ncbi:MAG: inositol monophosphatase family protein [Nitrososphaeraceae archaeon]
MISEILIQASKNVFHTVKDLIGTEEGSLKIARGAGGDISRKIDLVAEEAVLNTIKMSNFFPTVIGEECGIIYEKQDNQKNNGFLIMDAIDGTTNAVRGIPFFCCSLAYASDFYLSSVIDAVVLDLFTGDIYSASKGKGSFFNNKKINVRNTDLNTVRSIDDLRSIDSVIGTNVSGVTDDTLKELIKILSYSNHVRHFGANALELCYFAKGYMDAYIDIRGKIRSTDMAAGYLIAKEAGGKLFARNGKELDSDLNVTTRLSFYAVSHEKLFNLIKL